MRKELVLAYKHGSEKPEVLCSPEMPIHEQLEIVKKEKRVGRVHEKLSRIERYTLVGSHKFDSPAEVPTKAKAEKKAKA